MRGATHKAGTPLQEKETSQTVNVVRKPQGMSYIRADG